MAMVSGHSLEEVVAEWNNDDSWAIGPTQDRPMRALSIDLNVREVIQMARGVNKVILVGNVGGDPETATPNGNAVTNITLATSESWKDKQTGQRAHRMAAPRGVLRPPGGDRRRVPAQGFPGLRRRQPGSTRKWQGQDGQDRYTTEIVVDINGNMQLLGGRPSGDDYSVPRASLRRPQQDDSFDDDIPF